MATSKITLSFGATSVVFEYIKPDTIEPEKTRNFTQQTLDDNSRVYDVSGTPKRRWELRQDVPLDSSSLTNLETLYSLDTTINLLEEYIDSSVNYSVFFEDLIKRIENPGGSARINMTIQEV